MRSDITKSDGIRPGHPDLTPKAAQCVEQRRAPAGIEVRHHFVEQQYRRKASKPCDQFGIGKNKADEQRLLLPG